MEERGHVMNADAEKPLTPYQRAGGAPVVSRLARRFYEIMAERADAEAVRAMHGPDLGPISSKLEGFLAGWMGGPRDYFDDPTGPCIMSVHTRLPIGSRERDQWLTCMDQAVRETIPDETLRAVMGQAFAKLADAMTTRP